MKKLLICVFLFLLSGSIWGQAPDTLWSRLYGDRPEWDGLDMLYGAASTYDGGFVMNGYSSTYNDTIKGDQWVVKINSNGDTLWTATFGAFDRRDYGRDIIEAYDHNLVILGHGRVATTTEEYRLRLFKADSLGNQLWEKGFVGTGSFNTERLIETDDKGFAIVGYTDDRDVFLFKVDSLGDSSWVKTYGGPEDDMGFDLCQTNDGFMLAGSTVSYGAGSSDIYVIKTDAAGDTLWTRTFGGISFDEGRGITKTHDGNFLVAGYIVNINYDGYFIKIDPDGNTIWEKSVGQDAGNDMITFVTLTSDNGFIAAGRNFNVIDYHNDMYMIKLDANGDSLWSYSYINNTHDEGMIALETGTGYYLFGTRGASSSAAYRDYWVFAFDHAMSLNDAVPGAIPSSFTLRQNYPNPFNPNTMITFSLPTRVSVKLEVFNLLGQKVDCPVDQILPAGEHLIEWNSRDAGGKQLPSGIYFYRLRAGDFIDSKKMLLLK